MWPTDTDRVVWSVCLSVTVAIPAKMAEPIKKPLRLRTQVDPRNHVLDGGQILMKRGNFEGGKRFG